MSKASEWAAKIDLSSGMRSASIEKDLCFAGAGATAHVTAYPVNDPRLTVVSVGGYQFPTFTADEAIAFARWILDTFGDGPSA